MTIKEFAETIDFAKSRVQHNCEKFKPTEYHIYLSKDLRTGYFDTFLKPRVKDFDYVISYVLYYDTKSNWNGYWTEVLGFFNKDYEPCEISFTIDNYKTNWKLKNLSFQVYVGLSGAHNPVFMVVNEKTGEAKEIEGASSYKIGETLSILREELGDGKDKLQ
jgi:hypothetical protein